MKRLWQKFKKFITEGKRARRTHRCPECGCESFIRKRVYTNRRRHFGIGYSQRAYYKCTVCKCEWYILNNGEDF